MFQQFKTRAIGTEIMDDFSYTGDDLHKALREIAWVNRWLGGRNSIRKSIQQALTRKSLQAITPLRIIDLGCGSGDYLRSLADWGESRQIPLHITGADANPAIIRFAREQAKDYQNIHYICADILADSFDLSGYDLVLCGLFLHHLDETDQVKLLDKCMATGIKAVVVTDLHRHWLAYYLFKFICEVLNFSQMSKHDGPLSIRKGFTKADLVRLMEKCRVPDYELRWKWAFRYQMIIYNEKN